MEIFLYRSSTQYTIVIEENTVGFAFRMLLTSPRHRGTGTDSGFLGYHYKSRHQTANIFGSCDAALTSTPQTSLTKFPRIYESPLVEMLLL